MDLCVKDVAQLLRVSEVKIHEWLSQGVLPSYRIANEIRFNRLELETWLIEKGFPHPFPLSSEEGSDSLEPGILKYDLYRALYRGRVLESQSATNKSSLILETTQKVAHDYPIEAASLFKLLMAREKLMSTGLGQGVAVPHTREFLMETHFDAVYVVYPSEPIDFSSLDKQPVHTAFFLFACSDKTHLHLLAKIAGFCQNKQHLRFLQSKPPKDKLLEMVLRWEKQL
jgi:PTS system nitrogen regulatory IIA component